MPDTGLFTLANAVALPPSDARLSAMARHLDRLFDEDPPGFNAAFASALVRLSVADMSRLYSARDRAAGDQSSETHR